MALSTSPASVSGFPTKTSKTTTTTTTNATTNTNTNTTTTTAEKAKKEKRNSKSQNSSSNPEQTIIAYDTACDFYFTNDTSHSFEFDPFDSLSNGGTRTSKNDWNKNNNPSSSSTANSIEFTNYYESTSFDDSSSITLNEFVEALPPLLRRLGAEKAGKSLEEQRRMDEMRGMENDPVNRLFGRVDLSHPQTYQKYALSSPDKNYTRNLIATDHETFTLLLLCWNPDKESPIHDHPCDGCWMRVCEGRVREVRYEMPHEGTAMEEEKKKAGLVVTSDVELKDGELAFINDYKGYHKVGNPSKTTPAITMHLYCPPFYKCKLWLDPTDAKHPSNAYMCNYSEYGKREACDFFEVSII